MRRTLTLGDPAPGLAITLLLALAAGCSNAPSSGGQASTGSGPAACTGTAAATLYAADCTPPQTNTFCLIPQNTGL